MLESEYVTSFIDNDDGKTITINVPSGSKVIAPSADFLHDDDIPLPHGTHDIAAFKRSITTDKKVFVRMVLGSEIRVGDGPYSKDLLEHIKFDLNRRGAEFNGVMIFVNKSNGFGLTENKRMRPKVKEFEDLLRSSER